MSEGTVTISTATINDIAVLAQLGADTFVETFGSMYADEDLDAFLKEHHSHNAYRAAFNNPKVCTWLARAGDGTAVGFASAGPCHLPVPDMPPRSGELIRLYVLKSHQRGGLGVQLLERSLDFLETHFDHLYLSVFSGNTGAQRLYVRYGFEKIHDYHFMVGSHADDEYLMQRTRLIRPSSR
ncbi:MAG: GNAT family N-acetyltransferase [Pseudomonadota bacterium]